MGTAAFALSIPIAALHILLDRTFLNVVQWSGNIAIAIVAVLFLQRCKVQRLYQGLSGKEAPS
jgi:hypothetical protein